MSRTYAQRIEILELADDTPAYRVPESQRRSDKRRAGRHELAVRREDDPAASVAEVVANVPMPASPWRQRIAIHVQPHILFDFGFLSGRLGLPRCARRWKWALKKIKMNGKPIRIRDPGWCMV